MNKRIGYYCWAGPGTVRMIQLKYFNPQVGGSVMESYDLDQLQAVREKFGVTDAWISYSWGFGDETEKEDKLFTLSKLDNFKASGIKTHAYIQGPNLVYADFKDKQWWAKDLHGRLISYHRGRKVVCVNNPEYRAYIRHKLEEMLQHPFDGIFMDNIQMGQLGVPGTLTTGRAFFGCNCEHCNRLFFEQSGMNIKTAFKKLETRKKYLQFRTDSTTNFLTAVATQVRSAGKEFGSNSFDPKFEMEHVYGTNLNAVCELQDYLLFENHSLPQNSRKNNQYINTLIEESGIAKPVFVVSYNKGIGFDQAFTQSQLDHLFAEAWNGQFNLCLKGSEFVTKKKWHNLVASHYQQPLVKTGLFNSAIKELNKPKLSIRINLQNLNRFLPFTLMSWLFTGYMERKSLRTGLGWLQVLLLK